MLMISNGPGLAILLYGPLSLFSGPCPKQVAPLVHCHSNAAQRNALDHNRPLQESRSRSRSRSSYSYSYYLTVRVGGSPSDCT